MKIGAKNIKKNVMFVLSGTILTGDFFLKNTRFMLIIFVILILNIANKYSCDAKVAKIVSLQKELDDAKYESLIISTRLTSVGRQSNVRTLVNQYNLGLEVPKEPVYSLTK